MIKQQVTFIIPAEMPKQQLKDILSEALLEYHSDCSFIRDMSAQPEEKAAWQDKLDALESVSLEE